MKIHNLGRNNPSNRQIQSVVPQNNTVLFRMILVSFIHITYTERNIIPKIQENCYKKYRAYLWIGNIGITNYTIAIWTKNLHDYIGQSKNYT
jgi:hypothetical protein